MRRILIVIDGSENDSDSLTSAKNLADLIGAQLTVAFAGVPNQSLVGFGEFVASAGGVGRSTQNQARAKAAFDAVCGNFPDARFLIYDASPCFLP